MTAPDGLIDLVERFDRQQVAYRAGGYNETQRRTFAAAQEEKRDERTVRDDPLHGPLPSRGCAGGRRSVRPLRRRGAGDRRGAGLRGRAALALRGALRRTALLRRRPVPAPAARVPRGGGRARGAAGVRRPGQPAGRGRHLAVARPAGDGRPGDAERGLRPGGRADLPLGRRAPIDGRAAKDNGR